MRIVRVILLLVALSAALPTAATAQIPAAVTVEDAGNLSISLLTMGSGDEVWERYGHNALWVHDPVGGSDWVFNYGVFDFHAPGYWGRFIRGDWLYQLAVTDLANTLAQYEYLNRTVVAQELELTAEEKAELVSFLVYNYRPENREYLYDYFRDNCSTRIRDVLDRVLGGRLQAATDTVPSGTTYRWHSRRLMAGAPVVYTALNAGLGPAADRPISAWEEMFLPEKVEARVREIRVTGADGMDLPLVRSESVLFRAVDRPADRAEPPRWIPTYLAIGLLIAGLLAILGYASRDHAVARFVMAVSGAGWALVTGTGGFLLVGLWAFTNHTIADRNENLLQFDPLALPLIVLIPAVLYGARWGRRPVRVFTVAVALLSLLGFILQILPGLDQVNGEVIALLLPGNLALAWAIRQHLERTDGRTDIRHR